MSDRAEAATTAIKRGIIDFHGLAILSSVITSTAGLPPYGWKDGYADGKGIAKGMAELQSRSIGVGVGGARQRICWSVAAP